MVLVTCVMHSKMTIVYSFIMDQRWWKGQQWCQWNHPSIVCWLCFCIRRWKQTVKLDVSGTVLRDMLFFVPGIIRLGSPWRSVPWLPFIIVMAWMKRVSANQMQVVNYLICITNAVWYRVPEGQLSRVVLFKNNKQSVTSMDGLCWDEYKGKNNWTESETNCLVQVLDIGKSIICGLKNSPHKNMRWQDLISRVKVRKKWNSFQWEKSNWWGSLIPTLFHMLYVRRNQIHETM